MLDEYFSFGISEDGKIESLPLLLPGYTPNLNKLPLCASPLFPPLLPTNDLLAVLVRLGVQVDWEDEKACFDSFLRELAFFYVPGPTPTAVPQEDAEKDAAEKRVIQHVIFPAAKQYLVPPERLLKRDFVQVTSLESLYRVCVFRFLRARRGS